MASTMMPGSGLIRHITLRNLAMGIIFLSSVKHGGTLARANTIPVAAMAAAVPAAVAPIATMAAQAVATMAAQAVTTNPIGIVPFESITRAATTDQMSSFKLAAYFQPVFREATPKEINCAKQTVLSDALRSFNRFVFPEYPVSETMVGTGTGEHEAASQRPQVPLELAGMQGNPGEPAPYIPDTFSISDSSVAGSSIAALSIAGSSITGPSVSDLSVAGSSIAASSIAASSAAPFVAAPASFVAALASVTASSGPTMRSGSIFSGHQSRIEVTSVLPPAEEPDHVTLVPRTQPSLDVHARTASPATSAAGSVTSGLSYQTRRSNFLAGMNAFDHIDQYLSSEPVEAASREMFHNLPETSALGTYPPSIIVSLSRGSRELSPSPPSEPEPSVVETPEQVADLTALPAALLECSPVPLGVRLKHGTWHHNSKWPELPRRRSLKRSLEAALVGFEMLKKRTCFGSSFAGLNTGSF